MNCEKIRSLFNQNGIVHFTMYGLPYTIEKIENGASIWQGEYDKQKKLYDSVDSVLRNHYIYNESIEENDERIRDIS